MVDSRNFSSGVAGAKKWATTHIVAAAVIAFVAGALVHAILF